MHNLTCAASHSGPTPAPGLPATETHEPSSAPQGAAADATLSLAEAAPAPPPAEMLADAPSLEAPSSAELTATSVKSKSMASTKKDAESDDAAVQANADKPANTQASTPAAEPKPVAKQPAQKTVKYLSADDSNSAASPVITRQTIRAGRYVQPQSVRTYEFLNDATFTYPAAPAGTLRIVPEMRATDEAGTYSLQIAIRAEDRALAALSPMQITLVLDTSGSMAGAPFALATQFVQGLASKLRPQDRLSLVTVNRVASVLLENQAMGPVGVTTLTKQLAALAPNDVTDLTLGLLKAYELANQSYAANRLNRVILVSDGADNAGANAVATISQAAQDSDRQGIYLAGVGVGSGFNDYLMDTFTDKGRGAYVFLDSVAEVTRVLDDQHFVANFDLADKNIRLKMVMPEGFSMTEFHGEAVSSNKAEIVPQYLAPNDQMIYHLVVTSDRHETDVRAQTFAFEAEVTPLGGKPGLVQVEATVGQMLRDARNIIKGDAVVAFAEMLKKIKAPLVPNQEANLAELAKAMAALNTAQATLKDAELAAWLALGEQYERTLRFGEQRPGSRDQNRDDVAAALGLSPNTITGATLGGVAPASAIKVLSQLGNSTALMPQEGYKFVVLSSGPVWNPAPAGGGQLAGTVATDPTPAYLGYTTAPKDTRPVFDQNQVTLRLKAPKNAKSFSFDFNFFSAEYPSYVKQNYNDSFYAILQAASTNHGATTNISFDAAGNTLEVDNNYFQQPFHPIPNWGTGFDAHGSTGWLRTSWPIEGGEEFTLTFSVHDEGDAVYDSLVVLDNFAWHDFAAVGNTDPLN